MSMSSMISWKSTDPEDEKLLRLIPLFGILSGKHASLGQIRDWLRFIDLTVEDCQAQKNDESACKIWKR